MQAAIRGLVDRAGGVDAIATWDLQFDQVGVAGVAGEVIVVDASGDALSTYRAALTALERAPRPSPAPPPA